MSRLFGAFLPMLLIAAFVPLAGCTRTSDGSIEMGMPKPAFTMPSFERPRFRPRLWPFNRRAAEPQPVPPPPPAAGSFPPAPVGGAPVVRRPAPVRVEAVRARQPKRPRRSAVQAAAPQAPQKPLACKTATEVEGRVRVNCE